MDTKRNRTRKSKNKTKIQIQKLNETIENITRNEVKKNTNNFNLYNLYTSLGNINDYNLNYDNDYNKKNQELLEELKKKNSEKNKNFFYITTPKKYIFRVVEQYNENSIEIKFFINNPDDIKDICVKISIPIEKNKKIGNIDTLYYDNKCSISKIKLEKQKGTIEMLKTALQYVCDKYPYVIKFNLQDETHYNTSTEDKPHITAKRLLLGRPGWYEEHFEAKPENETSKLISVIEKYRNKINDTIKGIKPRESGEEWWTTKNILNLINQIGNTPIDNNDYKIERNIFGTSWFIRKGAIKTYKMKYNVVEDVNPDNIIENEYYKNYINIHERR
jgi:hypothetical protein